MFYLKEADEKEQLYKAVGRHSGQPLHPVRDIGEVFIAESTREAEAFSHGQFQ